MKYLLKKSLKSFSISLAILTVFSLNVSTAQSQQELTIDASTVEDSFFERFNGQQTGSVLGGISYFGNDFGGTTKGGDLQLVQNNNLGTITFNPNSPEDSNGRFHFTITFNLPAGVRPNPIEVIGRVTGSGYVDANNYAIIDFPNNAIVTAFNGGLFSITLHDVCLSNGQPCSIFRGEEGELQQPNNSDNAAKASVIVNRLKSRSSSGVFARRSLVNAPSAQAARTVSLSINGSITAIGAGGLPTGTCTYGQGYYKNTFGAIPLEFNDYDGFDAMGNYVEFDFDRDFARPFTANDHVFLGH